MTRTKLLLNFSIFLLFIVSLVSLSNATTDDNEIYIGGRFLEAFMSSKGNLKHAASLIAYSIENDQLDDDFGGILIDEDQLRTLTATPSGVYASGSFSYVDYDYSNTITEYDAEDDEWTSLNDGIWCSNCVEYIAGTSDAVFFAGDKIQTVEALPNTTLTGIVMMDPTTEDFFPLSDPDNIFPTTPTIDGFAASNNTVFIYESKSLTIYAYDVEKSSFSAPFSNFDMTIQTGTLTVASNGDIYVFAYAVDTENVTLSLYYWPADYTDGQAPKVLPIKKSAFADIICRYPIMTPYLDGVLISVPDPFAEVQCSSSFTYVASGEKVAADIPYSPYPVNLFSGGLNDEVWLVVDMNESALVYYWNSTYPNWGIVALDDIGITNFFVSLITYFDAKESLYLYVIDNTQDTSSFELVRIKSENAEVILKNPGSLASPGWVYGLAYDPDNEALYVGGLFSSAGGVVTENLAYYSFKDQDWQGFKGADKIQGLANIDSVIYMIFSQCGDAGDAIPFDAYSMSEDNINVKDNLPLFYQQDSCLYTISTNSTHVYIGGDFVAQFGTQLAYGVLTYYPEDGTWSTLPIDSSINDNTFQVESISEFSYQGAALVAIGGVFTFTADSNSYLNFALFNISSQTWVSVPVPDLPTINSIVYMYDGVLILAGRGTGGADGASVISFNITTSEYSALTGLTAQVNSLLLYTYTDNDGNPLDTSIYAGGFTTNGVSVTNYTTVDWQPVGAVYNGLYDGYTNTLIYSTGGVGANGQNGNSSSGGSDWWWITLIVIGSVFLVVLVVAFLAAGGFLLYKKKDQLRYASLN